MYRGEYKKKIFTKFFFYGHSFGAFTYLSNVFLEGKLLAKYNILGILLSAPYFTMRDDPLIEVMYNPFLNSLTPTHLYLVHLEILLMNGVIYLGHLLQSNVLPIWQSSFDK